MPRYYFNYLLNGSLQKDPDGSELPTDEDAIEEARNAARELVATKVRRGDIVDGDQFEITTGDGTLVATIPLRSILKLPTGEND